MIKKISDTVKKYHMLSEGETVLVAVSGGADSMLLLNYLLGIKDEYSLNIIAAHMEHGIRGKESVDDCLFVSEFCKKHNVKLYTKAICAPKEAKLCSMGVEEYSRKARYDFFDTIECDKLATAHNLTDNVETALFRLARGTGLKGICAIPPVRGKIIRPLIEITSQEIRDYCRDNKIEYRVDSTNSDCDYSRNLIRHKLLPLFERLNASYSQNINAFISDCADDYDYIKAQAKAAYEDAVTDDKIIIEKLSRYHPSIKKLVLKKYFEESGFPLDRVHLQAVMSLLDKSGKIQISGDAYAYSAKGILRSANMSLCKKNGDFVTNILNINEFKAKNIDFYCDCDKIIGSITVRSRKAGDEITPANRNCTKSLKKLFNELPVPIEKRNDNIVVCDEKGVIGVIGYCVSQRVKIDNGTEKVFIIKFLSED